MVFVRCVKFVHMCLQCPENGENCDTNPFVSGEFRRRPAYSFCYRAKLLVTVFRMPWPSKHRIHEWARAWENNSTACVFQLKTIHHIPRAVIGHIVGGSLAMQMCSTSEHALSLYTCIFHAYASCL